VKRFQANTSHRMRNKDKNTKGRLTGSTMVSEADEKRVKRMLCK
ncbi:MAG: bL35 family ribosomal protein, partial [Saprospiraceae bacterium]